MDDHRYRPDLPTSMELVRPQEYPMTATAMPAVTQIQDPPMGSQPSELQHSITPFRLAACTTSAAALPPKSPRRHPVALSELTPAPQRHGSRKVLHSGSVSAAHQSPRS